MGRGSAEVNHPPILSDFYRQAQNLQQRLRKYSSLDDAGHAPRDYPGKETAWIPNLEVHLEELNQESFAVSETEEGSDQPSRETV